MRPEYQHWMCLTLVVGGGTLEVAGELVFRHGANVLWMGSPDQIKDKREFYQPQMARAAQGNSTEQHMRTSNRFSPE